MQIFCAKLKKIWEKILSLQLIYDLLRHTGVEFKKLKGYEKVFIRNRNGARARHEC